jgi:Tol biopolymer transport system component
MVRSQSQRPVRLGIALLAAASIALPAVASAQEPTARASVATSGIGGDGPSWFPSLSASGRHVAFSSNAANLVPYDTNGVSDLFVRDRDPDGNGIFDEGGDVTVRVSVGFNGQESDGYSDWASISADGRFVAFHSGATNLVALDVNGAYDVFVFDRDPDGNGIFDEGNGVTARVSLGPAGLEGNDFSGYPSISADGRHVSFTSGATNLVANDTNGVLDAFVHDRDPDGNGIFDEGNGVTTRMSVDSSGLEADDFTDESAISANGRHVAFFGSADNLVANDTNWAFDVFVRDRDPDGNGIFDEGNGVTVRVSVDSAGVEGDSYSFFPAISGDGRHVAFYSDSDNLVANDTNGCEDVFVHDRDPDGNGKFDEGNGVTTRVDVGPAGLEANGGAYQCAISGDGRVVAFDSSATNLVPDDANGVYDTFAHDRDPDGNGIFDEGNGVTTRASVNACAFEGDGQCRSPAVSSDGRFVGFNSEATNLVTADTNGTDDVFVRDRLAPPPPSAAWSNYGAGYPGTLGVPGFTARSNPTLGASITLDIGNSQGRWAVGFLFAGLAQASIPTSAGGTLLVGQQILWLPVALMPFDMPVPGVVPSDPSLCGVAVFLQTLELDAGAPYGLSFTPGLELDLGH